jgi:hypothetical protein
VMVFLLFVSHPHITTRTTHRGQQVVAPQNRQGNSLRCMIRLVVATTTKHSLGHLRELLATGMIVIMPFIMAVVLLLLSAATFVVVAAAAVVLAAAMVWFVGGAPTTRTPMMMFRRLRHFNAIDNRAFFSQNSGYYNTKRERKKISLASAKSFCCCCSHPSIGFLSEPQKNDPYEHGRSVGWDNQTRRETAPPRHLTAEDERTNTRQQYHWCQGQSLRGAEGEMEKRASVRTAAVRGEEPLGLWFGTSFGGSLMVRV